ncbi:hypothetical protein HBI56_195180 [Parastagonospora nodorum]|nr:hypothetical protein HBH56_206860 [Parastagonospora nodorum]KAH3923830.1 hypothetical protein HBH54_205730 [Parastagonospora nodorum]KAH3942383.1 hypothetical protein HBH53_188640 [Parastagonospora nodorum]KAH3962284.1 hypothetical protein HBH51_177190 [Parastagonospora nodorum]KAH3967234.1 hypothetical protein HBH52_190700 [Parastagonospora nodorum]
MPRQVCCVDWRNAGTKSPQNGCRFPINQLLADPLQIFLCLHDRGSSFLTVKRGKLATAFTQSTPFSDSSSTGRICTVGSEGQLKTLKTGSGLRCAKSVSRWLPLHPVAPYDLDGAHGAMGPGLPRIIPADVGAGPAKNKDDDGVQ